MTCTWQPDDFEEQMQLAKEVIDEIKTEERSDLCETAEEAQLHVAAGRSWPALKESKTFDTARLNEAPLFRKAGLFK